jgi:hypothetical protein
MSKDVYNNEHARGLCAVPLDRRWAVRAARFLDATVIDSIAGRTQRGSCEWHADWAGPWKGLDDISHAYRSYGSEEKVSDAI